MISFSDEHSEKAESPIEFTEEGSVICVSEEQLENNLFGIYFIFPVISSVVTPLKISSPNEVTEEGIEICINDEHPEKAPFLIEVTEEGIEICVNDVHP